MNDFIKESYTTSATLLVVEYEVVGGVDGDRPPRRRVGVGGSAAPRVTAPENMRSIILVEMAIEVRKSSRTSSSGTKTHEEKGNH